MSTTAADLSLVDRRSSEGGWFNQALASFWKTALAAGVLSDMSFLDHLEELRKRLIRCVIAIAVGMLLCVAYAPNLILFLGAPARAAGLKLVAIESTEIFSIYFKVAAAGGICLAAPFILWQVWRFIEPALYKHEKRYAAPFLLSTIVCFGLGATFGYVVAAPWLLRLQKVWADLAGIEITMSTLSYFGLLTSTIVAMGPIVFILSRIGLIDARFLVRHAEHAVVISAIAAAMITPTGDMAPTIALMTVILGLYTVSILVAWVFGKPRSANAG
jgi:sec-independent protein translocase protein TatC